MIEHRPDRPSPYRVKRLGGKLTASFKNEKAAELQDALWGRWRDEIPVLADQEPTIDSDLLVRLLEKGLRSLAPSLLAALLREHPSRSAGLIAGVNTNGAGESFGEFLNGFFEDWEDGKVLGGRTGKKAEGTRDNMEDWLNKYVYEVVWEVDEKGHRVRDEETGLRIPIGWGSDALAWTLLPDLRPRHFVDLFDSMNKAEVGEEVQRKLHNFLSQAMNSAHLKDKYPEERRNPVSVVPAPKQKGVKKVRRPYLPEIVERIRADFLELERLVQAGERSSRGHKVDTPAGVPLPTVEGYGQSGADLVETIAFGAVRPGEALGAYGEAVAPQELEEDAERYWYIHQRNQDGHIIEGTKSTSFPERYAYVLGPLPDTLARLAKAAGPKGLLLPYPGTDQPWTRDQYKYWREHYFAPIARSHGLRELSDDPYALRHIYATLRLAAHHSAFEIGQSMGTGLVGKTYGVVKARYEGKGPLDIDAAIAAARAKASQG